MYVYDWIDLHDFLNVMQASLLFVQQQITFYPKCPATEIAERVCSLAAIYTLFSHLN